MTEKEEKVIRFLKLHFDDTEYFRFESHPDYLFGRKIYDPDRWVATVYFDEEENRVKMLLINKKGEVY
ncbi:hypothetical protein ACQKJC_08940 [Priestia koreensis]|uniref:hypothetical protein n=1 Tax=Priestia koreensis TaxID=284581 RepID=UPI003CFF96FE